MKNRILLRRLLAAFFLELLPLVFYGQPKSGHFIYQPISYEIIDSTEIDSAGVIALLEFMKSDFNTEVYFNPKWVVSVKKETGGKREIKYNRNSRVLYRYYERDEIKKVSIDSIQALKRNNKKLLAAIDTLKSDFQIIEYPKESKLIQGFSCHRVTVARGINPTRMDEVWIAKFENVPDLIFPGHLYFLLEGIPMEIVEDFEDIKFKWGVVVVLPVKADDEIFYQTKEGYEVSVDDTQKVIYDGIHFIRTYEPKKD